MASDLTFRPLQDENDFQCLAMIFSASENADGMSVTFLAADIREMLGTVSRLDLPHDLIIAEVNSQAVGFGYVHWWSDGSRSTYGLRGYVLPEMRCRGIGQKLFHWLEARAMAIAEASSGANADEDVATVPCFYHINATQFQAGVHALALDAGYTVRESWLLMVRPDLENIPDWSLPEGLEVRPALPEHFGDIWYAVCEAYAPYGGTLSREFPKDIKNSPQFQPELWQVAW